MSWHVAVSSLPPPTETLRRVKQRHGEENRVSVCPCASWCLCVPVRACVCVGRGGHVHLWEEIFGGSPISRMTLCLLLVARWLVVSISVAPTWQMRAIADRQFTEPSELEDRRRVQSVAEGKQTAALEAGLFPRVRGQGTAEICGSAALMSCDTEWRTCRNEAQCDPESPGAQVKSDIVERRKVALEQNKALRAGGEATSCFAERH